MGWSNPEPVGLTGPDADSLRRIFNSLSTYLATLDGDEEEEAAPAMPAGSMVAFAGSTAPDGWLKCDGSSLLRADYPDLFTAISTTYGAVDSTHFNLPDLRARVPVGLDNMGGSDAGRLDVSNTLGGTGGTQKVTLAEIEMPVHTHTQNQHRHGSSSGGSFRVAGGGTTNLNGGAISSSVDAMTDYQTPTINSAGGSGGVTQAHNNMQPYMLVNYIIKT